MLLAELTHSCRARQGLVGWTGGRLQHNNTKTLGTGTFHISQISIGA